MLKTMYPAQANSRQTELASAINATQTTITLVDASIVPAAPNLVTIGTDEGAETILYTGKSGNDLTGVTRGFQGVAASWAAGSKVARYFTAYDADAMRQNVESIDSQVEDKSKFEMYSRISQNQSIPTATETGIKFLYREIAGTGADFSETDEIGNIRFKQRGTYLYNARVVFSGSPTGSRTLTLTYNGGGLTSDVQRANDLGVTSLSITQIIKVNAGDTIGASVYQNSGDPLSVLGGPNQTFVQLSKFGETAPP